MHGSLRQRSVGSWELRVFVGFDPDSGRRVNRSVTVRGSRDDAERELARVVSDENASRTVGGRSPVVELLEAWFAASAPGWSPTTVRQTRSVMDCYLIPAYRDVIVSEVSTSMIDATYAKLRRCGGAGGRSLALGTIARIHVVLRSAFAQAVRWGWVWDNPVERTHKIVVVPAEIDPPTPGELRSLLDHVECRDRQLYVFLVLAAVTGARRAQLLGLRWNNINMGHGRLSFRAGWVEGPDGPTLTATKSKRAHVVDVDPDAFAVLVEHAVTVAGTAARDGFVFSDDHGATAWKPSRVTHAFLRHRRAASLRQFRLHDLRHFMATRMLDAGIPVVTVARRLDHRRPSTTFDRYAHAIPGRDVAASATLWHILQTG